MLLNHSIVATFIVSVLMQKKKDKNISAEFLTWTEVTLQCRRDNHRNQLHMQLRRHDDLQSSTCRTTCLENLLLYLVGICTIQFHRYFLTIRSASTIFGCWSEQEASESSKKSSFSVVLCFDVTNYNSTFTCNFQKKTKHNN